jgi:hypothetical protein
MIGLGVHLAIPTTRLKNPVTVNSRSRGASRGLGGDGSKRESPSLPQRGGLGEAVELILTVYTVEVRELSR